MTDMQLLLFNKEDIQKVSVDQENKFRLGVAVVLQDTNGGIFYALRSDEDGQGDWVTDENGEWVMPQGGLEENEDAYETLLRELNEEAGIVPEHVELIDTRDDYLAYKFEPLIEPAKWVGQAHKWFFCKFTGDPKLDVNIKAASPPEFQKYEWTTPEEIVKRAQPFHSRIYQTVLKDFNISADMNSKVELSTAKSNNKPFLS